MNTPAPTMLAPILRATDGKPCPLTLDEIVTTIRQAAANAALVMPPTAAKYFEDKLNEVATTAEGGGNIAWLIVNSWLNQIDEINAYAARARRHTEHEVFLAGSSPADARYTEPAETREDTLAADRWLAGAGAAHREVTRLYGPWQIDRPATTTTRETAA